jgi:hypothetical protein
VRSRRAAAWPPAPGAGRGDGEHPWSAGAKALPATGGGTTETEQVMADLKVDYALLDQSEVSLSGLVSEFEHIKAQESSYDGAMGSGDIASAMDDFAGNWDYHRKKLVGSLHALGSMINQTKQSFDDTDAKLQTSLTKH